MSRQATLFQSWGSGPQKSKMGQHTAVKSDNFAKDGMDDDDELLALAMEESLKDLQQPGTSAESEAPNVCPQLSDTKKNALLKKQSLLFNSVTRSDPGCQANITNEEVNDIGNSEVKVPDVTDIDSLEDHQGFDSYAGRMWIYPTNLPVREYQYSIVEEALFKNTLVVLPTGLGKTFIAAVVMYNFYRWYPQGKIIFMAPTKPLVAQQIEACYNIMGIPQEDTAEMTGAMQPAERQKVWQERRIFFLTPQVLTNDLSRNTCPALAVKCLVVDEAHKALGNHAYCQVVRELVKYSTKFRILALSATPGSDIKSVQQILNNLLIAHIELRSEDSKDLQAYTFERNVEKIVVPLDEELKSVRDKYLQILEAVVSRLKRQGVLYNRDVKSLSKFLVLKAREAFRQNPPTNLQCQQYGVVEGDFALSLSLYHGYELLQLHGLRSLFNFLEGIMSGEKSCGRTRSELQKNFIFCDLLKSLRDKFDHVRSLDPNVSFQSQNVPTEQRPVALGHPKVKCLETIVLNHFKTFHQDANSSSEPGTRIMIFSQYRDSVNEITEMLNRHRPLVKVMSFVGQSSVGKSSRGFTQKEQLKVMKKFREGGYNTLVSTCVGEEGLDIGDVDLIICFDAHKSPIRLVQRMGRTGRKRKGRIVMLVTEGKEEQVYNQSQYNKNRIHKAILSGAKSLVYYQNNPRMIPNGLNPPCHKMNLTVKADYKAQGKGKDNSFQKRKKQPHQRSVSAKRTDVAERGFLTDSEMQYWREHYEVPTAEVQFLPYSEFITLPPLKSKPAKREGIKLSLNAWMPWQNRLHVSNVSGHSNVTKLLVEMVQFVAIQKVIGSDEDIYGQEMALYLNDEDILRPGDQMSEKHGILKFCCRTKTDASDKSAEEQRSIEQSDDGVEILGCDMTEKGHDLFKNKLDVFHFIEKNEDDHTKKEECLPDLTITRKKKHENPTEKPVIHCVDDDDDDDFEAVPQLLSQKKYSTSDRKSVSNVGSGSADESGTTSELKMDCCPEVIPCNNEETRSTEQINDEEEYRLSQLLPIPSSAARSTASSECRRKCIKSPPPIDEISVTFQQLDRLGYISPVNIFELVCKWEKADTAISNPMITELLQSSNVCSVAGNGQDEGASDLCVELPEDPEQEHCVHQRIMSEMMPHEKDRSPVDGAEPHCGSSVNPLVREVTKISIEADTSNLFTSDSGESVILNTSKLGNDTMDHAGNDLAPSTKIHSVEKLDVSAKETAMPCQQINSFEDGAKRALFSVGDLVNTEPQSSNVNKNTRTKKAESTSTLPSSDEHHKDSVGEAFTMAAASENSSTTRCSKSVLPETFPLRNVSACLTTITPLKQSTPRCEKITADHHSMLHNKSQATGDLFDDEGDSILVTFDADGAEADSVKHAGDKSQLTFTQALNCLDVTLDRSQRLSKAPEWERDLDKRSGMTLLNKAEDKELAQRGNEINDKSEKMDKEDRSFGQHQQPKFDLGFDLDFDLEELDDEIVPPSPQHVTHPLTIRQVDKNMVNKVNQTISDERAKLSITKGDSARKLFIDVSTTSKSAFQSRNSVFRQQQKPVAVIAPSATAKPVPLQNVQDKMENSDICIPKDTKPTSSKYSTNKSHLSPRTTEDHIRQKECSFHQHKPEATVIPPVKKPTSCFSEDELSDDTDESLIKVPCQKAKGNVLASPVTSLGNVYSTSMNHSVRNITTPETVNKPCEKNPFKTPVRTFKRLKVKQAKVSSESDDTDESPFKLPKVKQAVILDDSDDEFVEAKLPAGGQWRRKQTVVSKDMLSINKPRQPTCVRNEFIEVEAAVSGSDVSMSSDESDGSNMDQFDASFIDDMTQQSQTCGPVDMKAVYLQSVHSPAMRGCYKLQYGRASNMDVFSQVPEQDTEYMEDSFCVFDDFEDSGINETKTEPSILEPRGVKRQRLQKAKFAELRSRKIQKSKITSKKWDLHGSEVKIKTEHTDTNRKQDAVKRLDGICKVDISQSIKRPHQQNEIQSLQQRNTPSDVANVTQVSHQWARGITSSDESPPLDSLRSRIQRRQAEQDKTNISDQKPSATTALPVIRREQLPVNSCMTSKKSTDVLKSEGPKLLETPVFSLDLGDLDIDMEETNDGSVKAPQGLTDMQTAKQFPSTSPHSTSVENLRKQSKISPPGIQTKEERLRLSRLKQEEFRKKFIQQNEQKRDLDKSMRFTEADSYRTLLPNLSPGEPVFSETGQTLENTRNNHSMVSSTSFTQIKDKLLVLVDTREITAAQNLVSALKFNHNLHTSIKSLGNCDYIVSTRMAIERKTVSDFTNGANKKKLLDRMRLLCELFERPCLIVEKDRVKQGCKETTKPLLCSKYVAHVVSSLAQTHIKLLYSDNETETASLIAALCLQEQKKNKAISYNVELNTSQEQELKFYLSLPKISYVLALRLLHSFTTISEFIKSSVMMLEKRADIPTPKARQIYDYLHHTFSPEMLNKGRH